MVSKYFTLQELGAHDWNQFHPEFINHLNDLRHVLAFPLHITSGARSKEHNEKVGGSARSLHVWDDPFYPAQKGCMAVDVAIANPTLKPEIVKTALILGWSVGINDKKRFVHIDRRVDIGLPQAVFSY